MFTSRVFLLILAVWAAIYLPGLGSTELKGEEGRRILPAREMLRTGDWVLPWSEGKPYHRKPPLVNWAIATSFTVAGAESELAARMPSALAVLLLALTGIWSGRILGGDRAALWLPLALLSGIGMVTKGRLAEIEAIYTSLSGIGILVWLAQWRRGANPWALWLPAGLLFGLTSYAKGPIFLPFFYAIAGVILAKSGKLRSLLHPAHLTALLLAVLLPLPWAMLTRQRLAALDSEGSRSQSQVWADQIVKRLDPRNIDWGSWVLNPFESLLLLCPWALLAIFLWRAARRGWWPRLPAQDQILTLGLGWGCLASGLVYSLLPESHARFQMPLAAPVSLLAVLLAIQWADYRTTSTPREDGADPDQHPGPPLASLGWRLPTQVLQLIFLLLTLGGAILPWFLIPAAPAVPFATIMLLTMPFWLLAIFTARLGFPGRLFAQFTLLAVWGIAFYAAVIIPWFRQHDDIRPAALQILEVTGPQPDIVAAYPGPQPFLFYLGTGCVEIDRIPQIPDKAAWLVIPEKRWTSESTQAKFGRQGFDTLALRVEDDDKTPYVLVRRNNTSAPGAPRPEDSTP